MAMVWLICTPAFATPSIQNPGVGSTETSSTQEGENSSIADFYRVTGTESIWISANGLSERGDRFINFLGQVEAEGLDSKRYLYDEILVYSRRENLCQLELWRLELLLDLVYLTLGKDLIQGRADWNVHDPRWHIPRSVASLSILAGILNSEIPIDRALRALGPKHYAFHQLKNVLVRYRDIERAGGWESIETRKSLKGGMETPLVAVLRERLSMAGDLDDADAVNPLLFDESLTKAVKAFQGRHGLEQDGVVGRKTREAMNVPVGERVRQIELNMERWRWLPRNLGDEYIIVNTAAFRLDYVKNAGTALSMRVIVGDQLNRTPVFTKELTYIDINPVWNVPHTIATDEILPQLAMKPDYLENNGFRILSDWSDSARELTFEETGWSVDNKSDFPYRLRQDSGDGNALGRIKFLLPNEYNIYLHDTPGKRLFNKPRRTFSHGCIRIENPRGLALNLFDQLKKWDEVRLDETLDSGENRKAVLKKPVPVYIVYLTSWVDESGTVHFSGDHYHRDSSLVRHLFPGEEVTY
ncbi:L,D-transpeptidase family protein [Solemya velesiana gill symbiont]|nr:L,D-transpeptidase family protein [Solemya velesiana gill symbiont]